MEASVISALASIVAAVMAIVGAIWNRRKSEEFNRKLNWIGNEQQKQLTLLKGELEQLTFIANSTYSKQVLVLAEVYSKLAEIKLLMESFVVPYFATSVTGDTQTLHEASRKFEEAHKLCVLNAIYINDKTNKKLAMVLGELMGSINSMLNLSESNHPSAWREQAAIVIDRVTPALSQIRDEVRKELRLDL